MFLYTIILFMMVAAGVVYVVNSPYFPIEHVEINGGLKRTDMKVLQNITAQHVRGNIFKIDLNEIKSEYKKLPWIKAVQVKRMWPDTIVVDLEERKPIAYWKEGGLVDENGEVFKVESQEDFPVFSGRKSILPKLTAFYVKNAPLFEKQQLVIREVNYTERAAWFLMLNNDVSLRLGRKNIDERVARFLSAWATVLSSKKNTLEYVDLRYKDGFAVKENAEKMKQLQKNEAIDEKALIE